jgi:hypothetical protein
VAADAASGCPSWATPADAVAAAAPWIKRRRENRPFFSLTFIPRDRVLVPAKLYAASNAQDGKTPAPGLPP